MLPFEEANRTELAAKFSDEFAIAREMMGIAAQVPIAVAASQKHTRHVRALIGGLIVRELRRFRSIIAILEVGYVENAAILGRSLYEGVLCERFILRSPQKKPSGKIQKELAEFSPDQRSQLYSVFPMLQRKHQFDRVSETENLDAVLGDDWRAQTSDWYQEAMIAIGFQWLRYQKKAHHYSGLRIGELADYCDLRQYHLVFYPEQCSKSHGNDACDYVTLAGGNLTFRLCPNWDSFRIEFVILGGLFGLILSDVVDEFGLDLSERLAELAQRVSSLGVE